MDRKVKKEWAKLPGGDVTKPWKRQFYETKSMGPEPPINASGFWRTPKHGILDKVKSKRKKNNDSSHDTGS